MPVLKGDCKYGEVLALNIGTISYKYTCDTATVYSQNGCYVS